MRSPKYWITNNWHLKIVSLVLAVMLWMAVANQASSEIGLEVPLEYRNIPRQLEITLEINGCLLNDESTPLSGRE